MAVKNYGSLNQPDAPSGMISVEPAANELFVDLDSKTAFEEFEQRLAMLQPSFGDKLKFTFTPSKTKGHYHARVILPKELPIEMRIGLQAVLGSDITRELLSLRRILEGLAPVTLFFEKE